MSPTERETKGAGQAQLLDFFSLREQPFGVTPDPRFLYFGQSHRKAFASLVYAIEAKRGFSALIAEPGMGKTSLLFHLLEKMQHSVRTAFLFQPEPDRHGLLRSLLTDLGTTAELQSISHMQEALNQILLAESRTGGHLVLVIDEAQHLEDSVLESVRLLSNFETLRAKLMHIVLAGQPSLATRLVKPELIQLRQRISAWAGLSRFTTEECKEYIGHRLKVAGTPNANLFPASSTSLIAVASNGIPRNINNICFACLSLAFATQQRQVSTGIVEEVLQDQQFERPKPTTKFPPPAVPQTPYLPPIPEPRRVRSSRRFGSAVFALIVIPPLLVFLASEVKIDFLRSEISAIGGDIFRRIDSSQIPGREVAGPLPLPKPPTMDFTPEISMQRKDVTDLTARPLAQQDAPGAPSKMSTKSQVAPRRQHPSRVVFAQKQESLFQLAMEQYGRANWLIVERIREQNPDIKDPFSYIDEGQRVVIPNLAPQFPWKEERNYSPSPRSH